MSRVSVSSDHSVASVVSTNPAGVDTIISNQSNDSDKTLSGSSDRSDSIGTTYRFDSQDSTTSVEGEAGSTWSSGRQMSIREWDIPLEELKVGDKLAAEGSALFMLETGMETLQSSFLTWKMLMMNLHS